MRSTVSVAADVCVARSISGVQGVAWGVTRVVLDVFVDGGDLHCATDGCAAASSSSESFVHGAAHTAATTRQTDEVLRHWDRRGAVWHARWIHVAVELDRSLLPAPILWPLRPQTPPARLFLFSLILFPSNGVEPRVLEPLTRCLLALRPWLRLCVSGPGSGSCMPES